MHTTNVIDDGQPALVELDIEALDETGLERFDPTTDGDKDTHRPPLDYTGATVAAVDVVGWADEKVLVFYDPDEAALRVKQLADGASAAAGREVGTVLVAVRGA